MRAALTSLVFVALAFAANAQFSLTPKAGLESSRTTLSYNDLKCLSPLGAVASPQIGLRMDYQFKKIGGPYLGISTSRSLVSFQFDNPETGMTSYTANPGNIQLRLEGGYRYSFKPIYFNKSSASKSASKKTEATQSTPTKSSCSKYARSSCGDKEKSASRNSCGDKSKKAPALAKNKGWNMRIQPSAGMAYIPGRPSNIVTGKNGANYQYNAGNWNTAFVAGTDFEFARGRARMFTLGFQYIRGLGNLETTTIASGTGTKATTTFLNSRSSSWNMTLGIPFTLSKKQSAAKQKKQEVIKIREVKKQCIYYKPCRRA